MPAVRILLVASLTLAFSASLARAKGPLHRQIDALILAAADGQQAAPRSSDADFVRRIYLDLAGRIPTAAECRRFLEDTSPDKRAKLIDRLLSGSDYPRRMSELLHIVLMERRGDHPQWTKFLRAMFEQNRPWDEVVRHILNPDAEDETARGAAYFYTSRLVKSGAMSEVDVPAVTRDVGRLFAGKNLECAQCHDHMSIGDYAQRDFQGLHAIFLNVKTRRGDVPAVDEGLMSAKHEFMSVFIQQPEKTGPVVPGAGEIEIPQYPEGEEYLRPPKGRKVLGVPKFSPLRALATELTRPGNKVFCKNAVNRFWFAMLGRGLVHPLDEHHGDNPPSHPRLLDLLADQFAAHDFNIRWLLREIALSETYQRSSRLPAGQQAPPEESFLVAIEKRISAEQLYWSTALITGIWQPGEKSKSQGGDTNEDLAKLREDFLEMYANPPKEPEVEFAPAVKGALYARNNSRLLKLFRTGQGTFVDALAKLPDEKLIDELFVRILSRRPTEEDRRDVVAYLKATKDRPAAASNVAWALWASNEFFINH